MLSLRYALPILAFTFLAISCHPSRSKTASKIYEPTIFGSISDKVENHTLLSVNENWKVAAYSRWNADNEPSTVWQIFSNTDGHWRLHETNTIQSAYNARLELRRDMRKDNEPIVIIKYQFGATIETLAVLSFKMGSLQLTQSITAGEFAWSIDSSSKIFRLIAIPDEINVPINYYIWESGQFISDHKHTASRSNVIINR